MFRKDFRKIDVFKTEGYAFEREAWEHFKERKAFCDSALRMYFTCMLCACVSVCVCVCHLGSEIWDLEVWGAAIF